jgi:hypothetical protein
LTGWYIQRKTETGNDFSSLVSKTYFENKKIGANSYFLVSKNSLGLTSFTLTESNIIQLKNSDQEIEDKIGWGNVESSVVNNPSEDKSIQRTNNEWIVSSPTPGKNNLSSPVTNSNNIEEDINNDDYLIQDINEVKNKILENPTIKIKILTNTLVFSGQPFDIKANIFGLSNEDIVLGKVYWNFGDGSSSEQINSFNKFQHTYYYPGEYVVYIEYYSNVLSKIPDAINKIIIKVAPVGVVISKVGDVNDFFIELTNKANSDIDVSKWVLRADEKDFVLPKNSVIMSKKSITISSRVTGFSTSDQSNIKLFSSTGELIFDYLPFRKSYKLVKDYSLINEVNIENKNKSSIEGDTQTKIPVDLLPAEVVKSDLSVKNLIYGVGLFIFIGISVSLAYFIRIRNRKPVFSTHENDFEILDE